MIDNSKWGSCAKSLEDCLHKLSSFFNSAMQFFSVNPIIFRFVIGTGGRYCSLNKYGCVVRLSILCENTYMAGSSDKQGKFFLKYLFDKLHIKSFFLNQTSAEHGHGILAHMLEEADLKIPFQREVYSLFYIFACDTA